MSSGTNGTTAAVDPLASLSQISMGNTMGAWLLGSVGITVFLSGLLLHQMYEYFREYSNDRRFLKIWVLSTVVLEMFISALTLHMAYFYLVEKYWEPTYFFLEKPVWSFNLLPCTAPTAVLVSQMFFVRRVWLFAPQFKIIVVIAFILNVSNVAFFAGLAVKLFESSSFVDGLKWSWLAAVGASMQMTGDIILTFTLIYVLRKSRTGIEGTDSMLDVLIAYAISTGALNSVIHILNVAFSIASPSNFVYIALSCILTKLYANTFLVALNTRHSLHSGMVENETKNFHAFSSVLPRPPHLTMPGFNHENMVPTAIELKVHREVTTAYDESDKHAKLKGERRLPSSMV